LEKTESALIRSLERDAFLVERVEHLMTMGPITALTWALEIGEVQRFSSIKKAVSYCGLCGDEQSSANTVQRTRLSKQRNKHLQTTLIEAAKMVPRYSSDLACRRAAGDSFERRPPPPESNPSRSSTLRDPKSADTSAGSTGTGSSVRG
jgi:transposase